MQDLNAIRDAIVGAMLPDVGTRGWRWDDAQSAAVRSGFQDIMCQAVFPGGLNDIVAHYTDMADRYMLARLGEIDTGGLRVRDRIREAVMTRLSFFSETGSEDAARAMLSYWAMPIRVLQGQRILWRSADRIWNWAGDTATDYNRYTKRGLLTSLMMGTTLVWLDDESENKTLTQAFLDRRLENVMEIGRAIGTIKPAMPDFTRRPWTGRK